MKNRFYIFTMLFSLVFVSCGSVPFLSNGYVVIPENPTSYHIVSNSVEVIIDKVSDNDIANQILSICESTFPVLNAETENNLNLDITVNQRSFFYDINQKNSIFVVYSLSDNYGNIKLQKDFYFVTKSSIISGKEQYKITDKIKNDIKNFLKKSSKNEKK